jgi:hypothetical protein
MGERRVVSRLIEAVTDAGRTGRGRLWYSLGWGLGSGLGLGSSRVGVEPNLDSNPASRNYNVVGKGVVDQVAFARPWAPYHYFLSTTYPLSSTVHHFNRA